MRSLKKKPDVYGNTGKPTKAAPAPIAMKVVPQEKAIDLIKAGNNEALQEMITQAGEELSFLNFLHSKTGRHPLAVAAEEGRQLETEILIGAKVEIDRVDDHGMTAIMYAAKNGEPDILKMLLDAGANIEAQHEATQENLLFLAAKQKHYNVVKQLIDLGREVEVINYRHETPLWNAIKTDQFELAKLLQQYGADINYTRPGGDSLLLTSSFQGYNLGQIDFLLANGANIAHQNESGVSAFMFCARHGHDVLLQKLLRFCHERHTELEKARKVAMEYGGSPVEYVKLPNVQDIDYLQLINLKDEGHKTALMYAAIHTKPACFDILLQETPVIDVFAQDRWGYSALFFLTRCPFNTMNQSQQTVVLHMIDSFLQHDPERLHFSRILDKCFNSAFSHACMKGNLIIAEKLLDEGYANYLQKNIEEKSAVQMIETPADRKYLADAIARFEARLVRDRAEGGEAAAEGQAQPQLPNPSNNEKVKPKWLRNLNRELYGGSSAK